MDKSGYLGKTPYLASARESLHIGTQQYISLSSFKLTLQNDLDIMYRRYDRALSAGNLLDERYYRGQIDFVTEMIEELSRC